MMLLSVSSSLFANKQESVVTHKIQKTEQEFLTKNVTAIKIAKKLNITIEQAEKITVFDKMLKECELDKKKVKAIEVMLARLARQDNSLLESFIQNLNLFLQPDKSQLILSLSSMLTQPSYLVDFARHPKLDLENLIKNSIYFECIAFMQSNLGLPDMEHVNRLIMLINQYANLADNNENMSKEAVKNSMMTAFMKMHYGQGLCSVESTDQLLQLLIFIQTNDPDDFEYQASKNDQIDGDAVENDQNESFMPSVVQWLNLFAIFMEKKGFPELLKVKELVSWPGFKKEKLFKQVFDFARRNQGSIGYLISVDSLNNLLQDIPFNKMKELVLAYHLMSEAAADKLFTLENKEVLCYFFKMPWYKEHILFKKPFTDANIVSLNASCMFYNSKKITRSSYQNLNWLAASLFVDKTYHLLDSVDLSSLLCKTLRYLASRQANSIYLTEINDLHDMIRSYALQYRLKAAALPWETMKQKLNTLIDHLEQAEEKQVKSINVIELKILKLLELAILTQFTHQARLEFQASLKEQFKNLEVSGASKSLQLKLKLGVMGAHLAGGAGSVSFTIAVKNDDTTSISVTTTVEPELSLSISEHVISCNLAGSTSVTVGKGFSSLDQVIDYYADYVLVLLLGQKTKFLSNIKGMLNANRDQSLKTALFNVGSELSHYLLTLGIIRKSDRVLFKNQQNISYIEIMETKLSAAASVSAGIEAAQLTVGASGQASYSKIQFKKRFNFIEGLIKNTNFLEKNKRYFRVRNIDPDTKFHVDSVLKNQEQSMEWYEATRQMIQVVDRYFSENNSSDPEYHIFKSMLMNKQSEIAALIEALFAEYRLYILTVKQYDAIHGNYQLWEKHNICDKVSTSIIDSVRNYMQDHANFYIKVDAFKNVKHSLENERNVHNFRAFKKWNAIKNDPGRVGMLKSIITSHVMLCLLYDQCEALLADDESSGADKKYQLMYEAYQNPAIGLDKKQKKLLSCFVKRQANSKKVSGAISGEIGSNIFGGPKFSASVTRSRFTNHFIREADGDDLTIELSFASGLSLLKPMKYVIEALSALPSHALFADAIPKAEYWNDIFKKIVDKFTLQFYFADTGYGYTLRYIRLLQKNELTLSTPNLTVFESGVASVKMKMSAATRETRVLKEYIGDNTLYYLFLQYHGFRSSGRAASAISNSDYSNVRKLGLSLDKSLQQDAWHKFVIQHTKELKRLCHNLYQIHENASKELLEFLKKDQMKDLPNSHEFEANLLHSIAAYNNSNKKDKTASYECVLANLNELVARVSYCMEDHAENAFELAGSDETDGASLSDPRFIDIQQLSQENIKGELKMLRRSSRLQNKKIVHDSKYDAELSTSWIKKPIRPNSEARLKKIKN